MIRMPHILSRDPVPCDPYTLHFDKDRAQLKTSTITHLALVHVIVNALK